MSMRSIRPFARVKLSPLTRPISSDFLFPGDSTTLGGLGPAHMLAHQHECGLKVSPVESRVSRRDQFPCNHASYYPRAAQFSACDRHRHDEDHQLKKHDRPRVIVPSQNSGGAVGELPPESESPDQRFLQAQLRVCLRPPTVSKPTDGGRSSLDFGRFAERTSHPSRTC